MWVSAFSWNSFDHCLYQYGLNVDIFNECLTEYVESEFAFIKWFQKSISWKLETTPSSPDLTTKPLPFSSPNSSFFALCVRVQCALNYDWIGCKLNSIKTKHFQHTSRHWLDGWHQVQRLLCVYVKFSCCNFLDKFHVLNYDNRMNTLS